MLLTILNKIGHQLEAFNSELRIHLIFLDLWSIAFLIWDFPLPKYMAILLFFFYILLVIIFHKRMKALMELPGALPSVWAYRLMPPLTTPCAVISVIRIRICISFEYNRGDEKQTLTTKCLDCAVSEQSLFRMWPVPIIPNINGLARRTCTIGIEMIW